MISDRLLFSARVTRARCTSHLQNTTVMKKETALFPFIRALPLLQVKTIGFDKTMSDQSNVKSNVDCYVKCEHCYMFTLRVFESFILSLCMVVSEQSHLVKDAITCSHIPVQCCVSCLICVILLFD